MQTAVWPFDVVNRPIPTDRDSPNHLRCFLICPFTPKDRFDDLYTLLCNVCLDVSKALSCKVECVRADKITSAGVIHSEIWTQISQADVIVADVSGLNANVMLELGVAATIKQKSQVIIIKDADCQELFLFDIGPARHILYKRTAAGFQRLYADLHFSLQMALSGAPLVHTGVISPELPLTADFANQADVSWLISPSTAHRRVLTDSLEYGSFYVFRNSWLSVSNLSISTFDLTAEIRFSECHDQSGWIGISLRNQSYFANYGHLFYLTTDGKVMRTEPQDDNGEFVESQIGLLPNFVLDATPHKFHARLTDTEFFFEVDGVGEKIAVANMPYVYAGGRILLQTYRVRAGLRSISISSV
jgi:hypothetical protein